MVVIRRPLILATDLVGLAALAALVTAAVGLVVMPALRDHGEAPRLRRALVAAQQREQKLTARNRAMTQAAQGLEASLSAQAERSPADIGTFLEYVSEQCRQCGIELQSVRPLATVSGEKYSSWNVEVRARGSFPDFQRLLDQTEGWSPYVHVEDISIRGSRAPLGAVCDLSWTVSIKHLPEWLGLHGESK